MQGLWPLLAHQGRLRRRPPHSPSGRRTVTDHDARKVPLEPELLTPEQIAEIHDQIATHIWHLNALNERLAKAREAGRKARGEK